MKRVVVIGAGGLLGQYLCREASARGLEVLGTYHRSNPWARFAPLTHLDITDEKEVGEVLESYGPDHVFLASATTNVEFCERHPQDAWAVNAEGTMNVAAAAKKIKAPLFYVSTDAVFNGEKGSKYHDFDTPDPISQYAQTKLEGERLTMDASSLNCVCRVAVMYGWNRAAPKFNFVTWALDELRKGRKINLLGDNYVSPTYAPHCAKVLLTMAERGSAGIYHTSGPDCLSRYEMGLRICEVFGLDPRLITSITSADIEQTVRRGKYTCLDNQKAEAEIGVDMLPFAEGLKDMKEHEPGKGAVDLATPG